MVKMQGVEYWTQQGGQKIFGRQNNFFIQPYNKIPESYLLHTFKVNLF